MRFVLNLFLAFLFTSYLQAAEVDLGQYKIITSGDTETKVTVQSLMKVTVIDKKTNSSLLSIELKNVNTGCGDCMDFQSGQLFVRQRKTYPDRTWVDELWRYDTRGVGTLIIGKDIVSPFRVFS